MTLRELAFPGCSAAYLSQIERGARTPSLQVIVQLAARLGVAAQFLSHGGTQPAPGDGTALAATRDGRSNGQEFDGYRLVLRAATTPAMRSWALIGLAQYALARGKTGCAIAALRESLRLLEPRSRAESAEGTNFLDLRHQDSDNRRPDEHALLQGRGRRSAEQA